MPSGNLLNAFGGLVAFTLAVQAPEARIEIEKKSAHIPKLETVQNTDKRLGKAVFSQLFQHPSLTAATQVQAAMLRQNAKVKRLNPPLSEGEVSKKIK